MSAHAGHSQIEDNQRDFPLGSAYDFKGFFPAGAGHDPVPEPSQNGRRESSDGFFIVHKQDGLGSSPGQIAFGVFLFGHCLMFSGRQIELEGRSLTDLAVAGDVASVALYDTVYGGKPQARSFAEFFRGEKGLEDVLHDILIHPLPGVGDGQENILPGACADMGIQVIIGKHDVFGFYHQCSSVRHGIGGVGSEVQQNLFDLHRVGGNESQLPSEMEIDIDHLGQRSFEDFSDADNLLVEVESGGFVFGLTAECEKLPDELRGMFNRFFYLPEFRVIRIGLAFFQRHQLGITVDHLQYIIEIMCYTAGKDADRLHLLGLLQLSFGCFQRRDIPGYRQDVGGAVVIKKTGGHEPRLDDTAFGREADLHIVHDALGFQFLNQCLSVPGVVPNLQIL